MENRTEKEPLELSELDLLVRKSDQEVDTFDPERIADVLVRETRMAPELARQLSLEVRDQIQRCGIVSLTSALIRELVDAKLLEYGLLAAHKAHSRLGVPIYDVDRVIQGAPQAIRGAHGPEGTSLALAEAIKRDYAMIAVFSDTVANAHFSGDLHIENLGEIDRPTALTCSIDTIKRHGIFLPGGFAGSKPARRPEVLAAHLVKYTAALQGYFSAPVAWDSLNYAFAPFAGEHDDRQMRQLAQGLLFELSAPALARGGQGLKCDLHLDIEVPEYLREQPVIGPGGEPLEATHGDFGEPALRLLRAILEVSLEGDGQGLSFVEPRSIVHITNECFTDERYQPLLRLATRVAAERGGILLAFDRSEGQGGLKAFETRYGFADERTVSEAGTWRWRSAVFSSVAINLPRIGYKAEGDRVRVVELLSELLELAAQASLEKRVFLEKLLARGEGGALGILGMRPGNESFLPLSRVLHAICPIGIAELAEAVFGKPLDESVDAQDFSTQVIAHLHSEVARLSAKHKVRFVLAEGRELSAPHRLARLDLRAYGREMVVQGTAQDAGENGELAYYTGGIKVPVTSSLKTVERLRIEGTIEGGHVFNAASDIWLEGVPSASSAGSLIAQIFSKTSIRAVSVSPEFNICLTCNEVTRGRSAVCSACGSDRLDHLAQEAGRLDRTSSWPRWKLAELGHRVRRDL